MTQSAESRERKPAAAVPRPAESLEELAAKQGIRPAEDLDALAAHWPVDDDPEALDAFIRDQRAGRRSVARGTR